MPNGYDLRIINIYKALSGGKEWWKSGAYYGCSADSTRKNKETNGLSSNLVYTVKEIMNEIKIYSIYSGFHPAKGFVFSDCNLTPRDMEYLSSNLPSINHTFELVDFSYNPQLGPLGLDYLIKGPLGLDYLINLIKDSHGIASLQSGNHDINLMYQGMLARPEFNTVKLDLSGCNIGDAGMDILAHALSNGKLPSLKHIDISGNGISRPKINEFLNQISQEMFLITEKAHDNGQNGQAVVKDCDSGSLYDMVIKSDEKDTTIEFADGTTGISSGVSAGDTCLPSVIVQISYCLGGGTGAMAAIYRSWKTCSKAPGGYILKLGCFGEAFLKGCAVTLTARSVTECASGREYEGSGFTASTDIDWDHCGNSGASVSDRGDFSFSATGGAEIGPTSIDNDNGLSGSNFDLSQHDF